MPLRGEYSDCFVGVQSYIFFGKSMLFLKTNIFHFNELVLIESYSFKIICRH